LTAGALVSFPGDEAAASIGTPVNREAQIATMLIIGFGVAFFGWILVHFASAPIQKGDQRPTASRIRRSLEGAYDRLQKDEE
jgi:hypothetical protein